MRVGMIRRAKEADALIVRGFKWTLAVCVCAGCTLTGCTLTGCTPAPVPVGAGSEKVMRVALLPDVPSNQLDSGEYFDVGYVYHSYYLFFLPVWNFNGQWCGYLETPGHYAEVAEADLRTRAVAAGIELAARPRLPWWDRVGGKVACVALIAGLVLFFAWGRLIGPREEE